MQKQFEKLLTRFASGYGARLRSTLIVYSGHASGGKEFVPNVFYIAGANFYSGFESHSVQIFFLFLFTFSLFKMTGETAEGCSIVCVF